MFENSFVAAVGVAGREELGFKPSLRLYSDHPLFS
jgi:hypothetical protein